MENRILIPLDGTEQVSEIIRYAQSITPCADTEISLLHVLPQAGAEHGAAAHIEEIMAALTTAGWTVSSDLRMGNSVEEIVKFALLMPATLLLMSTHGRSGLEKIRKGSVTEQVLQHSPCPVFILHSTRAEPADDREDNLFKRILVPLDGTDVSASILSCVERFSKAHDSEVILFHDEMDSDSPDEERAAVKLALQEHSVKLANAGLKVSLDMSTYRRPIREILNKIDEMKIDLVSMASHGESGVRRALDESVTAEVIRHSSCPLLVWSAEHQFPPVAGD
ncbi:MAG: universal stress protein [Gammaproteobacteria bacterium]|jgi:nucleotide-binding universal stress UspA family protein|nr:universal stress protein [Gammaproteobacteria bacterium]MDH3935469.1 universal stress protein [Gammaproteobacteria bacterium]MDH3971077.1 universal stress protein [Gammaproteobacteria bacterium]MDH3987148.1 universal stress protein [Gammaproteobacteria bacterium]